MKKMFYLFVLIVVLSSCDYKIYKYNNKEVFEMDYTIIELWYARGQFDFISNTTTDYDCHYNYDFCKVLNDVYVDGYNDAKNGDIRIKKNMITNKWDVTKSFWDNKEIETTCLYFSF